MRPEGYLYIAVIKQAVVDSEVNINSVKPSIREEKIKAKIEATRWLKGKSEEPLSFNWCCLAIGLDPTYIRRKIYGGEFKQDVYGPFAKRLAEARAKRGKGSKNRPDIGKIGEILCGKTAQTWRLTGEWQQPGGVEAELRPATGH